MQSNCQKISFTTEHKVEAYHLDKMSSTSLDKPLPFAGRAVIYLNRRFSLCVFTCLGLKGQEICFCTGKINCSLNLGIALGANTGSKRVRKTDNLLSFLINFYL